jgi:hypothetical protein
MEPHPGQLYKKIISFYKYSLIQGGFPIAPLNPFGHNVGFPIDSNKGVTGVFAP